MRDCDGDGWQSHALIVAAGRYTDSTLTELRSPSRDAQEFAQVLQDPAIGGFSVQSLLNEPDYLVREEIEGFFADRSLDDVLILYLSCHGVKDASGRLYFAAATTKVNRLSSTGISADFVYEQVDHCRARRILILLDCCYSGAYLAGYRTRGEQRAFIGQLEGRGRAVITSSTALEYAFEIDTGGVTGSAVPSVFTTALVEGLRTGAADRDGDGLVSVDDLYSYVYERVREVNPNQTPEKKWGDIRGDFIIARNPHPLPVQTQPAAIETVDRLDSPINYGHRARFNIVPQPTPSRYPVWRKIYLWLISLAGAGICIGVLAASLAPSPGNKYEPVGGILGSLGLLFAAWIGWYAHRVSLGKAKDARLSSREPRISKHGQRSKPMLARVRQSPTFVSLFSVLRLLIGNQKPNRGQRQ